MIMKKFILSLFSLAVCSPFWAQKVSGNLKLESGSTYEVTLRINTTVAQQAMGQAFDFTLDATGNHSYRVTNANNDNSTLNHSMQRISFLFDGMGQKRNFDSGNEKDMDGPFGKPVKELLSRTYDMVIDPSGNTLMVLPEKWEEKAQDPRMAIMTNMMKGIYELASPPQKGNPSFFRVLPENELGIGDTWTSSRTDAGGKLDAAYKISDINDSVIVVDFATSSVTVSKAEVMGSETTTTMNNKSTGKIILDRNTRLIREKTEQTESSGNTETSFGSLPVTSRSNSTITVRKKE